MYQDGEEHYINHQYHLKKKKKRAPEGYRDLLIPIINSFNFPIAPIQKKNSEKMIADFYMLMNLNSYDS